MVSLLPMKAQEFKRFRSHFIEQYVQSIVSNYGYAENESLHFATIDFDMRLPDGLDTKGNTLCSIVVGNQPIGHLWYVENQAESTAFICDFYLE